MKNKLRIILSLLFLSNILYCVNLFANNAEFNVPTLSLDTNELSIFDTNKSINRDKFRNSVQKVDKNIPNITSDNRKGIEINHTSNKSSKIVEGEFYDVVATQNNNGTSTISFSFTKEFPTNLQIINFPFRIIFDVPQPYKWRVPFSSLENYNLAKIFSSISYGKVGEGSFRILANLKYPVNISNAVVVKNSNDSNYKFIIDVRQADTLTSLLSSNTLVIPRTAEYYNLLNKSSENQQNISVNTKTEVAINNWVGGYLDNITYPRPYLQVPEKANAAGSKRYVVVIDPGHGGKDPGAMPSLTSSVREKDIVLAISKYISNNLLRNPNIAVVLLRTGDYFIPLKDRILWAKRFNADLFVSIHADRAPSEESFGMSVYTLSNVASDAQTQVIAADQNKSDIIAGLKDNDDSEVSRILINLLQRLKVNDSVILAKSILNSVSTDIKLLPNPIRFAGFAVLQVPEIPSVLIETGFLSNTSDTVNLKDQRYQQLIASKIAKGIEDYLISNDKANDT